MSSSATRSHRDYARWRTRQIAYGRWEPWTDAAPVREHLRQLRATGASREALARAAGVSPMTIYRLQRNDPSNGQPALHRIRSAQAQRLLAVTPATLRTTIARQDATGTRRRLQALVAMGHPAVSLARHLGVPPRKTWDIIRGTRATVTPEMHAAVCDLYERLWDQCPPERTAAERRAATSARARAATQGWPTPMGLDDDHIDDPTYQPRTTWRPATGTGVTAASSDVYPGDAQSVRSAQRSTLIDRTVFAVNAATSKAPCCSACGKITRMLDFDGDAPHPGPRCRASYGETRPTREASMTEIPSLQV